MDYEPALKAAKQVIAKVEANRKTVYQGVELDQFCAVDLSISDLVTLVKGVEYFMLLEEAIANACDTDTQSDISFEYRKLTGEICDCGGEFDEDDRCDSCSNGHDDCSTNECFACMERAMDRAELASDLAKDEEMGL